ncbi:MAG TPA: ABC transporter permease, partial [Candidatus Angelobacter sp.]|nr:ABC transporter permease [Candidatus Angelobacter sp.]
GRTQSSRTQDVMVVLQTGLALVLLMAAGLLAQSLRHLKNQDFGFQTQGRLILTVAPPTQYTPGQLPPLYQRLQQQLTSVPGVESASMSLYSPMDGHGWDEPISVNGKEIVHPLQHSKWPAQNRVSTHYFETIGTPILRGRPIAEQDTADSQHVAVVSESFARTFFPGQDALGKHFGVEEPGHSNDYEIVGITEDTKYAFPDDKADPIFFLPLSQSEGTYEDSAQAAEQRMTHYIGSVQLRVAGAPGSYDQPVRRALAAVDPNLTITAMRSFSDQLAMNFSGKDLLATLTTAFGLLALLLASIGLYGVVAYTVARHTNEIGIRMALGANRVNVVRMVLLGAMKLVILGLLIGIPVALLAGRAIASQLFGVLPYDPLILGASALTLLACAALAALLPARRAAAIDPMIALRAE